MANPVQRPSRMTVFRLLLDGAFLPVVCAQIAVALIVLSGMNNQYADLAAQMVAPTLLGSAALVICLLIARLWHSAALGAVAVLALGLAFWPAASGTQLCGVASCADVTPGGRYIGGALVGQHGSWNRKPVSGYKVVFVPFAAGKPAGKAQDFLTGFLDSKGQALGRPVGVAFDRTGAALVADDVGNIVWRVSVAK